VDSGVSNRLCLYSAARINSSARNYFGICEILDVLGTTSDFEASRVPLVLRQAFWHFLMVTMKRSDLSRSESNGSDLLFHQG
jgi:hypothetical protein